MISAHFSDRRWYVRSALLACLLAAGAAQAKIASTAELQAGLKFESEFDSATLIALSNGSGNGLVALGSPNRRSDGANVRLGAQALAAQGVRLSALQLGSDVSLAAATSGPGAYRLESVGALAPAGAAADRAQAVAPERADSAVSALPISEPRVLALLSVGLIGLLLSRRRLE